LPNFFHVQYTDNPYGYYKLFDCFFLTSLIDPCPIVVLENLLLNKIVIVLKDNIFYLHDKKVLKNYIVINNTNKSEDDIIKTVSKKLKKNKKDTSGESYIMENFSEKKLKTKIGSIINEI
jgi:hypothetical protein